MAAYCVARDFARRDRAVNVMRSDAAGCACLHVAEYDLDVVVIFRSLSAQWNWNVPRSAEIRLN